MRRRRTSAPTDPPFVGDTVTLRAGEIVFGGATLAHLEDGRVVFLSFAAPGELVEAKIDKVHADYLEASVATVLEPSPDRVEPRCPLFGECGGCQLQHITYEAQLRAKEAVVREQLRRIGHLEGDFVRPIVGAANPWAYRNHLRLSTGNNFGDVGFISRRGRRLLKVESCPIAEPWIDAVLPALQGHGAGLHQVQVRYSAATGSHMITPAIPGIALESGQTSYIEEMGGHRFQVGASAFFQVNHAQAVEMMRLVGEALPASGKDFVDGFAGVGTFAVLFADRFERVIAIEESHSATRDADVNLADTPNVEMHAGKVEDLLPLLDASPDAIVLDPPRPGCHPRVIASIVEFRPSVVVYVSCNPATLARDLRLLVDGGYTLDSVTPLDMFPQTGHIECVARLSLADPGPPAE